MPTQADLRAACRGAVVALDGRLEPWHWQLLARPEQVLDLVAAHDSPINLIEPSLLGQRAEALVVAGTARGVDTRVFFARKANKALALVDQALAAGHGVDVASERELAQVLAAGAAPERVIVTAAVKPRRLLHLAVAGGVRISVDNGDELRLLQQVAEEHGCSPPVALRISGRSPIASRFGLREDEWARLLDRGALAGVVVEGVHVHLHGYSAADRSRALRTCLTLAEVLRRAGHPVRWIDLGGGVPMRYLEGPEPWRAFWAEHRRGLALRQPLTWEGRGLGLHVTGDRVQGEPAVYPMWQDPVGADWLGEVLDAPLTDRSPTKTPGADAPARAEVGRRSLAEALTERGLRLHLEPGRALLDGCGLTVARVESRKLRPDGRWLISLAMNRTQCRSAAEDFLLDPLLLPTGEGARTPPGEGFLVGAYCIEAELLSWRRFVFPAGVAVGDLVVFVNTAGYQMHILESASHQAPLARNLVPDGRGGWRLDRIDDPATAPSALVGRPGDPVLGPIGQPVP